MSKRVKELTNKGVVPGDALCVIEEFLPGSGTYEHHNGVVRAALVGSTIADLNTRVINVKPRIKEPILPRRGSIVYGIIVLIREEYAIVRLVSDVNGVKYHTVFTAILHISQVTDKFIKDLFEVLRMGDVVKAKVLNDSIPYNISIKDPKLGVVLAFCGKCGSLLKFESGDLLKCPVCGNSERRKVSIDYGKLKGLIPWIK